ncbi:hypothetical protein [Pedobacter agri]|uniref:hypothetical protein n=1 Tax=Pedobacter agri TaxID=454586 RepID=UPI00292CA88A|nr:hypothetical protein [Pedobacter agri]
MYPNHELSALRNRLLEKIGSTSLGPGDCSEISVQIFISTGHYVSKSTIKRIFGTAPTLSDSSRFVKNAISNFLGFENWEALKEAIDKEK